MRKIHRPWTLIIVLVLATCPNLPVAAQEQIEHALVRDADWYASHYKVPPQEALRRLHLQGPVNDLDALLTEKEKGTFAGLWIQHRPDFRVVVQFTGNSTATLRPYVVTGPLASIVDVRTVSVPLTSLSSLRDTVANLVVRVTIPVDIATNVMANRVEIYVVDPEQFAAALQRANLQLPEQVAVVKVPSLMQPNANIFGGLPLDSGSIKPYCTMGFSVKNSSGTKFITTAGHCENTMTHLGVSLSRAGRVYAGSYDLQWLNPSGFIPVNLVKTGATTTRTITGSKSRSNQSIGEVVCKYGAKTAYSCAQIVQKDFQPSYVPSASATFIRVESNYSPIASDGDSGGPWFNGNTAYGIHSGSDHNYNAIYMPIDFLTGQGLTLLTN